MDCLKCGKAITARKKRNGELALYRQRYCSRSCKNSQGRSRWIKAHPVEFREYHANWRAKNPSKIKAYSLKKYGLTPAERAAMLIAQNGKCAMAGCPNPATETDHNHRTGQHRALLCQPCNLGLGAFRDSPRLLVDAIAYLFKWEACYGQNAATRQDPRA